MFNEEPESLFSSETLVIGGCVERIRRSRSWYQFIYSRFHPGINF